MASRNLDAKSTAHFDLDAMMEALIQGRGDWVYAETRPFAEAGVAKAQLVMGILHQVGIGVPQDGIQALTYYRAAAEQNEAIAWRNLGTMYLLGLADIAVDKAEARECFSRARAIEIEEAAKEVGHHTTIH